MFLKKIFSTYRYEPSLTISPSSRKRKGSTYINSVYRFPLNLKSTLFVLTYQISTTSRRKVTGRISKIKNKTIPTMEKKKVKRTL